MSDLRELVEAVREARERPGAIGLTGRALELADHLLTHPEAVEAYEAVMALGKARRRETEFALTHLSGHPGSAEERMQARDAVYALADRLAKGGDHG